MSIETEAGPRSIALGMLSWRAPATVDHTLASYARESIFELFDHVLLYCQEISDQDRNIAAKYGVACTGNDRNRGICGGVRALLESMDDDYVLMVENDCLLIESHDEVARQLHSAVRDMAAGRAQVFRMRHRRSPGEDFTTVEKYRRYHLPTDGSQSPYSYLTRMGVRLRALLRPVKAERIKGIAAYVEEHPERRFPRVFQTTPEGNLIVDSAHMNWTNQSILVDRRWTLETLLPWVEAHPSRRTVQGFPDIEKELNGRWWRSQGFRIGLTPGLFTHQRLDR